MNEKWSRWYLVREQGAPKIKRSRQVNGKTTWQRYPAAKYKKLPGQEIEALVRRLNTTYEIERRLAEERYNFDHAYINKNSLELFETHLKKNAEDRGHVGTTMTRLKVYVFDYFVNKCQLPDPSRWHLKEDSWGTWLLNKDLSPTVIRKIVATANRFTQFLVDRVYPEMQAARILEPVGANVLREMSAKLVKEKSRKTKYIKEAVFNQILEKAAQEDPEILPNIKLCYSFGLRISETLGLSREKLLKESLLVDEQGDGVVNGKQTKRSTKSFSRRVPYWNMSAKEAWQLIQAIKPMHHNTLIKRVNWLLADFGHTSHDFRRTFITNSFRKAHWKDVMKAAGHRDVRTTFLYDQDDRGLSEELADLD